MDELSDDFNRHCANMRVGIALKQVQRLWKYFRFLGSAGPFLAPVARQRVQSRTSDPLIVIVQHFHQIGKSFGREIPVEKPAAMQSDISNVVPQTGSHCRKCFDPELEQSPISFWRFVPECEFSDDLVVLCQCL
ncbi:hypothetical protein [Bradyrhizobium neotropicale]|uniref:Uncharacterized protein n=1 Tax=Bradyrhizobium neotropicale TaxID=1497615 RepID=A0A176ZEY7_9BRAD|nr:hypothetical protein [Bradyrhizobium neotropicale]OAF19109.1 hypothetical protein AXW67_39595 [Bradyrhizobium neotropicale]